MKFSRTILIILANLFKVFKDSEYFKTILKPFIISILIFFIVLTITKSALSYFFSDSIIDTFSWIIVILIASGSSLLSTLILAGFYNEKIVAIYFAKANISVTPSSLPRQLLRQIITTILVLMASLFTFILSFALPLAFLVSILTILIFAFSIIDIPLTMLEKSVTAKIKFSLKNIPSLLVLGGYALIIASIPVLGILLLPSAYLSAAEIANKY